MTAFMTVHQHTPNSSATCDTGRASSPTWRHASVPARRVNTTWASRCCDVSVHVLLAQRLPAPPSPLHPHQPRRSPETGQIPDRHPHPILGLGPGAAPSTADTIGHCLDRDNQLRDGLGNVEHPEPGQSQQRLRQTSTVAHAGVSSPLLPQTAVTMTGPLPRVVDGQLPATPHFNAKRFVMVRSCPSGAIRTAQSGLPNRCSRCTNDVPRHR